MFLFSILQIKFYDENTRQWWVPVTGGSNVPALNELLAPWGVAFGDTVLDGEFELSGREVRYASGTSIVRFPGDGLVVIPENKLTDQGLEIISSASGASNGKEAIKAQLADAAGSPVLAQLPVMGFYQTKSTARGGRLAVYGDSNCIDSAHMVKDCWWLLDGVLEYTSAGHLPSVFADAAVPQPFASLLLPERMEQNQLHMYSKVLQSDIGYLQHATRGLPACVVPAWSIPQPLNRTSPTNLYQSQKLLSLNVEDLAAALPPRWPQDGEDSEADFLPAEVDDWMGPFDSSPSLVAEREPHSQLSLFSLFGLLCAACWLSYRYCRARHHVLRLRRPKPPRLPAILLPAGLSSGPRNV